ncbi:MAG: prolipoprotein diacylglyceryl transferase [Anaerolineae bacterium]|nr:prolipoprotein diacylglyceryl transferase [Anaerolineae bacterium]
MYIGSWFIQRYTLRALLGALLALAYLAWKGYRRGYNPWQVVGLAWISAIGALAAGRIGYGMANVAYFAQHPVDIFRVWEMGGLHGSAAWIGGAIGSAWWAFQHRKSFTEVWNFLSVPALIVASSIWWGCTDTGCVWGREVGASSGWQRAIALESPDIYRTLAPRYPVPASAAAWALLMAGLAAALNHCGALAVSLYMAGLAGISTVRGDPVPMVGPYRMDVVSNLILAAMFWASQWLSGRPKHATPQHYRESLQKEHNGEQNHWDSP